MRLEELLGKLEKIAIEGWQFGTEIKGGQYGWKTHIEAFPIFIYESSGLPHCPTIFQIKVESPYDQSIGHIFTDENGVIEEFYGRLSKKYDELRNKRKTNLLIDLNAV